MVILCVFHMWLYELCGCIAAIDLKRDMAVYEGACKNGKVELMLTISDENFVDMATGKLDGQQVR